MKAAILDFRRAAKATARVPEKATTDLVRLFALDRPPARRQLVCRWRRDLDGRLVAHWEPDIVPPCLF